MVTKDLQTLNLKFHQVMFNSLVLTWERNFEVTFGILSVLVFQISCEKFSKPGNDLKREKHVRAAWHTPAMVYDNCI